MDVREKEVEGLKAQALALSQEDSNTVEVDGKLQAVENRFTELRAPLQERCDKLLASKEEHQFNRDLEDEIVSCRKGWAPEQGCRNKERMHFASKANPECIQTLLLTESCF